jgi:hypothetical protein
MFGTGTKQPKALAAFQKEFAGVALKTMKAIAP